jgi:hypothetical protein
VSGIVGSWDREMMRNGLGKRLPPEAVSHELTIQRTNSPCLVGVSVH